MKNTINIAQRILTESRGSSKIGVTDAQLKAEFKKIERFFKKHGFKLEVMHIDRNKRGDISSDTLAIAEVLPIDGAAYSDVDNFGAVEFQYGESYGGTTITIGIDSENEVEYFWPDVEPKKLLGKVTQRDVDGYVKFLKDYIDDEYS
jgi:hypothetical protein